MQRLADLRTTIASLPEAEETFRDYALARTRIAARDARFKRDLARRLAALRDENSADAALAERCETAIGAFVISHTDLFSKPRTRKTEFGKFGLQTVTDLVIAADATEALIERIMDLGYDDCLKCVRSPVKPALTARIQAGESFPGCTLRTGDTVVCDVSPAILKKAAEESAPQS